MDLGKLERARVKEAWPHEAHNFIPWLAENLDRLSAELGIDDLELEGTEVTVGPHRADTVAQMPQGSSRVGVRSHRSWRENTRFATVMRKNERDFSHCSWRNRTVPLPWLPDR